MGNKIKSLLIYYYKYYRWHLKAILRMALRKILYNTEYYDSTHDSKSGVYQVSTSRINMIYSFKTPHKKRAAGKIQQAFYKFKELYFNTQIQPLRKLDKNMIYSSKENFESNNVKIEDTLFYISAKKHFEDEVPWEETSYWDIFLHESGGSIVKARQSLDVWEKLFFSIQKRGYLSQSKIKSGFCLNCRYRAAEANQCPRCGFFNKKEDLIRNHVHDLQLSEIAVHIGQDGELYLSQGRHRLTYAKLLDIKKVFVNIIVRHKKWVDFRENIIKIANSNLGKISYPLDHIDLLNIPSIYKEKSFNKLLSKLIKLEGPVLELNSKWSFFSKKLADANFESHVHYADSDNFEFYDTLKKSQYGKYNIIKSNIFEFVDNKTSFSTVILADNISFLFDRERFTEICHILEKIEFKLLLINVIHKSDQSNIKHFKNLFTEELEFKNHQFLYYDDFSTIILRKY